MYAFGRYLYEHFESLEIIILGQHYVANAEISACSLRRLFTAQHPMLDKGRSEISLHGVHCKIYMLAPCRFPVPIHLRSLCNNYI